MNYFGKIVKNYLTENKITQRTIANNLQVGENTVSNLLNRNNISLDKMLMIAEAINCDLEIKLVPKQSEHLE